MTDLFDADLFDGESEHFLPLAAQLRPRSIDDYIGQSQVLGDGKPLKMAIEKGQLHSFILWGPPGTGKTTLARLFAQENDVHFISISAVTGGIKEIRDAVAKARLVQQGSGQRSVVFVDEVHRFNKSQQDGFLPHIEDGTFFFIGATTENPSFHLNSALLSRTRVYRLESLQSSDLAILMERALSMLSIARAVNVKIGAEARSLLVSLTGGDARRLLNMLEILSQVVGEQSTLEVTPQLVSHTFDVNLKRFDKGGDVFYDQISALHKSIRGSDPDGALYWFCRMIDGGCEPLYIGRRLVRMASEDIGNADPRALEISLSACQAFERLGSPEGELALAQAVIYLAVAAKSNAVYNAYNSCMAFIRQSDDYDVPMHLRNAPTDLMKEHGMGEGYRYAHDEPDAFAAGEVYLPEEIQSDTYYHPVNRGMESKIAEKLKYLQERNRRASLKRYQS